MFLYGAIVTFNRTNFRLALPCAIVTVIVSGAVPFSMTLTPELDAAEVGPIVKTVGQDTRSNPDSTVRVASGVSESSARGKVKTMLPPQIQQAEAEDGPEIPPQLMAQLQSQEQQIQKLTQALQGAAAEIDDQEKKLNAEVEKARIQQETSIEVARINADSRSDVEELKGMIAIILQKMQPPPALANEVAEDLSEP